MNLHGEIMNIQVEDQPYVDPCYKKAYKIGHRDARHAAADLAVKSEKRINELEKALGDLLASHQDFANCERNPDIGRPDLKWSEEIEEHAIVILNGEYDD